MHLNLRFACASVCARITEQILSQVTIYESTCEYAARAGITQGSRNYPGGATSNPGGYPCEIMRFKKGP